MQQKTQHNNNLTNAMQAFRLLSIEERELFFACQTIAPVKLKENPPKKAPFTYSVAHYLKKLKADHNCQVKRRLKSLKIKEMPL